MADVQADDKIYVAQSKDGSNKLYSSNFMSAYELAYGLTRPFLSHAQVIPDERFEAHNTTESERELTRVLCSKTLNTIPVAVGDMVDLYVQKASENRETWSSPHTLLSVNSESGTVAVHGTAGRPMKAALDDIRPFMDDATFTKLVQKTNDTVDKSVNEFMNSKCNTQLLITELLPSNDYAHLKSNAGDEALITHVDECGASN